MNNPTPNPNGLTITRNDMEVRCYGKMEPGQNTVIVGDWADGEELEEYCCDTFNDWNEAVEQITAWAKREGHTVLELSAC